MSGGQRGALVALLAAVAAAVGGFSLLLPVAPLVVGQRGGGPVAVGAATAVFMATTVAAQLLTPRVLRRRGHRWALLVGTVLMGAPALAVPLLGGVAAVLAASGVRGVGFGLVTVAGFALVAELVEPGRLGRATGALGVALGAPQLLLLPTGVFLLDRLGATGVLVLGGVLPLLGTAAAARLPGSVRAAGADPGGVRALLVAARVPVAAIGACALGYGATVTFLPAAVPGRVQLVALCLAAMAAAMLVGRALAGVLVDRGVPGRLLAPATAAGALGVGLLAAGTAVGGTVQAVLLGLGVVALGGGFGAAQNDGIVLLFSRTGPAGRSGASAAFNVAYDAGTGLGAGVVGLSVAGLGYPGGFGLLAAVLVLVVPLAVPLARPPRPSPMPPTPPDLGLRA